MFNKKTLIFLDFETVSVNPWKTQPVQLAACAVDAETLKIKDGGTFESLVRLEEEKVYELDPWSDEAARVHKKSYEEVKKAPSLKVVWKQFCEWVDMCSNKGKPILIGFNNNNFDDVILQRICCGHFFYLNNTELKALGKKEPWGFGPTDKNPYEQGLFDRRSLDAYKHVFTWLEGRNIYLKGMSLDALREFFGLSLEGAHDALVDVKDTAEIFCRFLRLQRNIKFRPENACAKGRLVTNDKV